MTKKRFFRPPFFLYIVTNTRKGAIRRSLSAQAGRSCKWLFFFRFLDKLKELPAELDEKKFKNLTESSKVSNFTKEEYEAYQKVYHKEWDHNAMVDGIFEEFADEINAKVNESVSEREREMAKGLRDDNVPMEIIVRRTGLSEEEIRKL